MNVSVDEFVESKVLPEYRPLVAELRALIKESAPQAREVISYGLPMYIQRQTLCWISPGKTGISLGFTYGGSFEDRYRLLRGSAKHARHVKMRNPAQMNRPALEYYVEQALKRDAG